MLCVCSIITNVSVPKKSLSPKCTQLKIACLLRLSIVSWVVWYYKNVVYMTNPFWITLHCYYINSSNVQFGRRWGGVHLRKFFSQLQSSLYIEVNRCQRSQNFQHFLVKFSPLYCISASTPQNMVTSYEPIN